MVHTLPDWLESQNQVDCLDPEMILMAREGTLTEEDVAQTQSRFLGGAEQVRLAHNMEYKHEHEQDEEEVY